MQPLGTAFIKMIRTGLAAPVLAKIAGEFDEPRLHSVLDGKIQFVDYRSVGKK